MTEFIRVEPIVPGTAHGKVVRLVEPLSFWGGIDPATGRIIDVHHPQCGQRTSGVILVMPSARGSSSSSSVLLECVRLGTAPSAIVLGSLDPILVAGAAAAQEIYGDGPAILQTARIDAFADKAVVAIDLVGRARRLDADESATDDNGHEHLDSRT
jgi:uncharacterized protein